MWCYHALLFEGYLGVRIVWVCGLGVSVRACVDCECNLLFFWILQQRFWRPPPSTAMSASGTSREWPIWHIVSRYIFWEWFDLTWNVVLSCIAFRRLPRGSDCWSEEWCDGSREFVFKNTGDGVCNPLTVNVIGLLFLQQCFIRLLSSKEPSISGTSRKWPICNLVSQYVYWRMTWRYVNSCSCDWRVQTGVWVGELVLKNAGDWVYYHGPFIESHQYGI